MSTRLVARQTLREAYRNRWLPAVVVLFGLLFGLFGLFFGWYAAKGGGEAGTLLVFAVLAASILVPAVGSIVGHGAVAGQREDGRLRLVLGQPISRRDVVVGAYAANAVVLLVAICVAGAAAALGTAVAGVTPPVEDLGRFVLGTCLLGLSYLGIAIAASATFRRTDTTAMVAFGSVLLFLLFWRLLPDAVLLVADVLELSVTRGPWADLVAGLSPSVAYERLLAPVVPLDGLLGSRYYDSVEFGAAVLGFWIVVVPALALWRFRSTDL